ncbi:uncharacterized protein LOC124310260 [Neodiprion virginianus]|uniref:Uncharacterized protein LOC107220126 n=1 Tax=Neodiprion lecontei TaxID=441921 RepID=A0A6J0BGY8_NEOLC|nr:uncharacterized protein LOC107220126 [Neodiprion lecontei]XP_046436015.1 uncharacterized protein LOC124187871 [Neodiprion fabricii]XP_046492973.1 uncharacterized protein LOC124224813 [Neodiprion pinetum]XP_046630028.1 uncharacterized protein LOC124310260 [Neodiprion virginianus]
MRPCTYEFSRGRGTGVAEAIGNWGFSNSVSSPGQELRRLQCLFAKMDSLRSTKKPMCVRYDCRNDPEAWEVKPSPHECKPAWTFPEKRPLIVYNSCADIIVVSNLVDVGSDLSYPIPGRSYMAQGSNKWYKRGPDCCPQPSCLAPQCPRPCCN